MENIRTHQSTAAASEASANSRTERLEHEKEQLKRMLDLAPGSIIVHDQEGRILYANRFASNLHGYSQDEFLLLRIHDILAAKEAVEAPAKIAKIFDHQEPVSFEAMHARKDGTTFPMLVNIRETQWNGRRVLLSVSNDLSGQKKAESDLKNDEARLESLLRVAQYRATSSADLLDMALHEALSLTGSSLGYIYNYSEERKQFELNSWSKDVLAACSIMEKRTIYNLDKTGIWGEAVRQRKPILINDFSIPHPLKKGYPEGHAPLHRFLTIPVFAGDTIVAVVGVANKEQPYDEADIRQLTLLMCAVWNYVELRRTDDLVLKNAQKYRSLFEHSPAALWEEDFSEVKKQFDALRAGGVTDLGAYLDATPGELERLASQIKILDVNASSARLLGAASRDEVIRNLPAYFTADSISLFREEMIALYDGASSFSGEIPILDIKGKKLQLNLQLNVVPGHEADFSRVLLSFTDLTTFRAAEHAIMRAEKLESLGILAAGIAHDFNNLLNGVFGYIDLARQTADDEKTRQNLNKAFGVFDTAKELASRLLTFSKGGAPALYPLDTVPLLRSTVADTLNGSSITPDFTIDADLAACNADKEQLAQVFRQITRNAVEAMPHGGTIEVTAVNTPAGSDPQAPSIRRPYIRITFTDHGTGISPEHYAHIFDPFFTTKPQHNGLGLTTVYAIIKRHHGTISIESNAGSGTTATIYLPAQYQ